MTLKHPVSRMGRGSPRLPLRQVLGYGLGHVFNDICASLWFTYLLIFLQKVATTSIIFSFSVKICKAFMNEKESNL